MVTIFTEESQNVKLRGRGVVSATYVSTKVSCPSSCVLRESGCYAEMGNVGRFTWKLNKNVPPGMRPEAAAREERRKILGSFGGGPVPQDGSRGGRDLRLHVAGDARTKRSAQILADAAWDWIARGGGSVWTYTHAWRVIRRKEWGQISVLASIEDPKDASKVRAQGYAPAIVVQTHPGSKAYKIKGSRTTWIPCPEQTRGIPCSDCRLCFDSDRLYQKNMGIAFAAHGATQKIKKHLKVVK